MHPDYYQKQFLVEGSHWWYVGRRRVLEQVMSRFRVGSPGRMLEVGCGGGGNLPLLARHAGQLAAVEMETSAVEAARSRGIGTVEQGKLGDRLKALDSQYDMLAMFDVLEHIPDDAGALREAGRLLPHGGRLFITVPAYPALWSKHDEVAHHCRRYTRGSLLRLLQANGFRPLYASYFNTFLFPVAALTLLLARFLAADPEPAIQQPSRLINRALTGIFSLESRLIPSLRLPFGLSIVVVAERG
jgi:SAM-dependent methyltransferase